MKEIKIYGIACAECIDTKSVVQDVVQENKIEANIVRIENIDDIVKENIFSIPAIAIDGQIVFEGACPSKSFLESVLVA